MDDRVKLTLLGISYSPVQSGAFAMLLAEENGPLRIPVVIGASEAQSIAIKLEGVVTPRPMTHDLFHSFALSFGIELKEVNIYKFEDGIFSSELIFTDGEREVSIDSRTSDAVAIAMRSEAPIYIKRSILEEVGTVFDEKTEAKLSGESSEAVDSPKEQNLENLSVEELQSRLNKCIEDENYEEAAKISEILKKKN